MSFRLILSTNGMSRKWCLYSILGKQYSKSTVRFDTFRQYGKNWLSKIILVSYLDDITVQFQPTPILGTLYITYFTNYLVMVDIFV